METKKVNIGLSTHYENDELPSQSNINDDKKVKDLESPQKSSSIHR